MRTPKTTTHMSVTRRVGLSVAAVTAIAGLGACSESAGPEEGEVTTEDLQQIQDDLGAIEDRVEAIESAAPAAEGVADDDELAGDDMTDELFEDGESLIGQDVTVSAAVTEVVVSGDSGIAFMIGGESGEPVAVLSADPMADLELETVVEVSGTVVTIQRDTFEEDFGFAEDELFDDPDAFFAEHEGEVALAADTVDIIEEEPEE